MLAINKEGQVFQVSFYSSQFGVKTIKNLKKSKVHTNRKGWPNELLWLADGRHIDDPIKGVADYLVCDDKFTVPIGTVSDRGVLCDARYSEREYRALEKA